MSNRTQLILDRLQSLCKAEASELVGQIEAAFNVDVSSEEIAPFSISPIDLTQDLTQNETSKDGASFDVILEEIIAGRKISVLKVVRVLNNLSLAKTKILIESAPTIVRSNLTFDAAAEIKQQLEAAGAIVSLR
ncbi:MAG: ribosomal protein L7/L12 [Cyanobacteriota bacterium]|nr:ribosomal protein L7/L12 [Cyanobacteriota bacterium]